MSWVIFLYVEGRRRGSSDTPATEGSDVESGGSDAVALSSKFHFVDLAGSERASKTGNRGERFKG